MGVIVVPVLFILHLFFTLLILFFTSLYYFLLYHNTQQDTKSSFLFEASKLKICQKFLLK